MNFAITKVYPNKRVLRLFKYACVGYAIIEIILLIVSSLLSLFMQFFLFMSSAVLQIIILLLIAWSLYKFDLKSIKLCILVSIIAQIGVAIILPILNTQSDATDYLCGEILMYSVNSTSISQCNQLLVSRNSLKYILIIEIPLRFLWLIACIVGYIGKKNYLSFIQAAKTEKKREKQKELEILKEKERRYKERQRKELKLKVLKI
jgi:signal transduction histidine kinase